jgi:modulator of FtsH protease HflC
MKAERLAEASFLRARGQEAAQSLRAIADRQAVEIIAAARRDAEILRGEGEGERTTIFADAYNRDPEFFEFYRSMQSYRTALGAQGTTMVLSPDSEFFRYFGNLGTPGSSTFAAPGGEAPEVMEPAAAAEAPAAEAPATEAPAPEASAATTEAPAATAAPAVDAAGEADAAGTGGQ